MLSPDERSLLRSHLSAGGIPDSLAGIIVDLAELVGLDDLDQHLAQAESELIDLALRTWDDGDGTFLQRERLL